MPTTYHIWLNEAAKGPLTIGQVRAMWNSGQLTGENLFSTDGGAEWHTLSDILTELEPASTTSPLSPTSGAHHETQVTSDYQQRLAGYLNKGWTVVSEGPTGAQLQGPKQMAVMTKVCLGFGVVLLLAYGGGIILIVAALIGHANQKPKTEFISRDNTSGLIKSQNIQTRTAEESRSNARTAVIALVAAIILILGVVVVVNAKRESAQNFNNIASQLSDATNNPSSGSGPSETTSTDTNNAPLAASNPNPIFNTSSDDSDLKVKFDDTLKLAAQNDPKAEYEVGRMYHHGLGTKEDDAQALTWFKKSAESGYVKGQMAMGELNYNGEIIEKNLTAAFGWYTKAALQDDPGAEYKLASMYDAGEGTSVGFPDAHQWYEKAAANKVPEASFYLGVMSATGRGVPQDYGKAFDWYTQSANAGYSLAEENLGQLYYDGRGVKEDHALAFDWFLKAANQGVVSAEVLVGSLYFIGDGVEKDADKGKTWLEAAAKQGNTDAQTILAKYKSLENSPSTESTSSQLEASTTASPATSTDSISPWTPPSPIPSQANWTWTTTDGKTYKEVVIKGIEPDCVTILDDSGGARIDISTLDPAIQKQLNFDPKTASQVAAQRTQQKAAQNQ